MTKHLLILQNADFEAPGFLLDWAQARGFSTKVVQPFLGDSLPPLDGFSHLIVLGTPHSVSEIGNVPWLSAEAGYLEGAIQKKSMRILGICFGAQLLAHLLGGQVVPGAHAEVGWHEVKILEEKLPMFLWHKEIFKLPPGATALGVSAGCELQAFSKGNVLALAGHPEITVGLVKSFIASCWSDDWYKGEVALGIAKFVQTPEQMLSLAEAKILESKNAVRSLLDNWAG